MKQKRFPLLILLCLVVVVSKGQQSVQITSNGIGYLQYLPQGYNTNSNKYPVVISLHGIREKGSCTNDPSIIRSQVPTVANVGLPKYIKYGAQYPFIMIAPQLKNCHGSWPADYVISVINYVKTKLRIDPSRIYLTGLSLGGGGVWTTVGAYPSVFAAVLPVCPGYNALSKACGIAASDVPVWDFHGDADGIVSYQVSLKMVNAINNCTPKPTPLAKLTLFSGAGHIIWDKVYKETNALTWLLSFRNGSTSTSNVVPTVYAGADKTVVLPSNAVTLYGSASDPDGTITSYQWTKKMGGNATMSGTTSKELKASNLAEGSYLFALTAKDDKGATASDDVAVKVTKSSVTTNVLPVANAGSDKTVALPTNAITIFGSGRDSDGTIVSYTWTKVSGGTVYMNNTNSSALKLSGLRSGTYYFRLAVKDSKGAVDTDDVKVTVNAPPIANAGSDRTYSLPLSSFTLSGSGSDADGTIVSYLWSKYSGPIAKFSSTTSKTITVSNLYAGTYIFKLAVKDNSGLVDFDYVKVVVSSGIAQVSPLTDEERTAISGHAVTAAP